MKARLMKASDTEETILYVLSRTVLGHVTPIGVFSSMDIIYSKTGIRSDRWQRSPTEKEATVYYGGSFILIAEKLALDKFSFFPGSVHIPENPIETWI